ncbi:hypothetical protein ACEOUU_06985 [Pseudomonas aeruginosa]
MEQAMRDEFEAWVRTQVRGASLATVLVYSAGNDLYLNPHIQGRYEGWKASRAALRVDDEINRLKAENEALLLGMRAILNAYDYADQYNKEGVAVEVMEDLRTLFKGATK